MLKSLKPAVRTKSSKHVFSNSEEGPRFSTKKINSKMLFKKQTLYIAVKKVEITLGVAVNAQRESRGILLLFL